MSDKRTDQLMRTTLFLLILVRCVLACYLRPGTVTGFHTKKQDNRPQHLIHVQLTDQVSSITTRSVVLGFKHLHLPRNVANVNV